MVVGGPVRGEVAHAASGGGNGGRGRILAVDDNPQDLRYVRDTLTKAGYAPVVTGDPEEALRLMSEERPDLVLLDLMLPTPRASI